VELENAARAGRRQFRATTAFVDGARRTRQKLWLDAAASIFRMIYKNAEMDE